MTEIYVDPDRRDDQGWTASYYFRERTNTPSRTLKADQTKPTDQDILEFEALIEKTTRHDEWVWSKPASRAFRLSVHASSLPCSSTEYNADFKQDSNPKIQKCTIKLRKGVDM